MEFHRIAPRIKSKGRVRAKSVRLAARFVSIVGIVRPAFPMALIRFGEFELDEQTFELRKDGASLRIQQQPARVLALLLSHRGALVTRDQIRSAIWGGDTFVDFEQGLNFCIRQIRITLNDHAEKPRFIETLPRLGYRFLATVENVEERKAAADRRRIRIGIVPFEDMGAAVEDYFAVGLTEDMISALSRIDPARLRVTAGPRLQNAEPQTELLDRLQRELDLDYLLRGSVRRSGETIRIGAQLHDLKDRSVMWSETYDRKSSDLLAVQEEVTRRVSQSLALELLPGEATGTRKYAQSSAAYDAYLKGRYFWHKMSPDAIRSSVTYFNEALAIDPKFAPAYAGLADCYAQMGSIRVATMKPLDALPHARSYLQRAMELDDTLSEAHCTLALIKSWYDWDWEGAEREFKVALSLDPVNVTALIWQSLYFDAMGRNEEAVASVQRAKESDPLSVSVNLYLALAQSHGGKYDLALRGLRQTIELDPHYYRSHLFLGRTLAWLNREDEAIVEFQKALSYNPENLEALAFMGAAMASKGDRQGALKILKKVRAAESRTDPSIMIAYIYACLGEASEMFDWIERAVNQKAAPIYLVMISEPFFRYRTDPRYHSFLASIGLPHLARF